MDVRNDLFARELARGEHVAWIIRWFLYGLLFVLAGTVYLIHHAMFAVFAMCAIAVFLVLNAAVTPLVRRDRPPAWIRYASVSLDVLMITLYNLWETLGYTPYTPVTTAMLLVYPLVILLAALRLDRRLIFYATALCVLSAAGLYAVARPRMDEGVIAILSSADLPGEIYRCVYLALCGLIISFIPRTVDRLLRRQGELELESRERLASAHTDKLTGLANRRELEASLGRAVAAAVETGRSFGLFFLDLDGFKAVNDRFGHAEGDRVLVQVAARLTHVLRESDLVARVGGDEFVVVAGESNNLPRLEHLAQRILEAMDQPFVVAGEAVSVGASIGIALFPGDGRTAEEILVAADGAMYRAKKAGKNRWIYAGAACR